MNGRLCQRLEPFAEEHYINTRPRCIFRHSFLLLYGGGFFFSPPRFSPTPVFLPGESQGQGNLVISDTTEVT